MKYRVRSVGVPGYRFAYELEFPERKFLVDAIYVFLICPDHNHVFLVDSNPKALRLETDEVGTSCMSAYASEHGYDTNPAKKVNPTFLF